MKKHVFFISVIVLIVAVLTIAIKPSKDAIYVIFCFMFAIINYVLYYKET